MKRSFETIDLIRERYNEICDFYFSVFRYTSSIDFNKDANLLKLLLSSDEFMEEYSEFYPIKENAFDNAIKLDRYELEGSLISMLIHGTCTNAIVSNEDEARMLVNKMLTELRITGNDVTAFRLDDPRWSNVMLSATYSKFYVIYQCLHRYWMFIGFVDFY